MQKGRWERFVKTQPCLHSFKNGWGYSSAQAIDLGLCHLSWSDIGSLGIGDYTDLNLYAI
jgi:hypothetical protein